MDQRLQQAVFLFIYNMILYLREREMEDNIKVTEKQAGEIVRRTAAVGVFGNGLLSGF